jgi:phenylacetate-CoA ligase
MHLGVFQNLISLRREQWQDVETIRSSQYSRLKRILRSAAKTEYYKEISPDAELQDIQPTPKMDVRRNRELFLNPEFGGKRLRMVTTSGSSGIPIRVSMDKNSDAYRRAILLFIQLEQGISPRALTVRVDSGRLPFKHVQTSFLGLFRTLLFHSSTSDSNLLRVIKPLNVDHMCIYPSIAYSLAKENRKDEFKIKIKSFVCGGEILSEENRRTISDSFSCKVFNKYSCWEMGPLAWECPEEHSLHVDAGTLLEIVDSNNKPVKSGMGRVLVTSLHNQAMPLLRYDVGDYASWGKECPCGRGLQVLKEVHGRTTEFVTLPSGKKRAALTMNVHKMDRVLEGTLQHQLVQETPELFVFRYIPFGKELDKKSEEEIRSKLLAACDGEDVRMEFEVVDKIERDKSGKLKRVISKVKSDD